MAVVMTSAGETLLGVGLHSNLVWRESEVEGGRDREGRRERKGEGGRGREREGGREGGRGRRELSASFDSLLKPTFRGQ